MWGRWPMWSRRLLLVVALVAVWAASVTARRQTAPGAPTIGTATAISRATVTFTAPASDGGSPILDYTATSSPGGRTATCKWSPCYVDGLSTGQAYTFTVTARNAVGSGSASAASNSVTVDASLIPTGYSTTWTGAGVDIPTRTTQCGSTIAAATYNNGADDASAAIQAAVNACPDDQVVVLGAGTFTLNNYVRLGNHKTLRGQGPGVTILQKRDSYQLPVTPGGNAVTEANPLIVIGPTKVLNYNFTPIDLTSDGVRGATSITVANTTGLSVDQIVKIDQDDYTYATWGRFPAPETATGNLITLFTDELWLPVKCIENVDTDNDGINDCTVGTPPTTETFPTSGGSIPLPAGLSWHSRAGRFTAEIKEIQSIVGNTVTFKTPLHADFKVAKSAQVIGWTGTSVHSRWSGLEDLSLTGGSEGTIVFVGAAYSWVKNVDNYGYGSPVDIRNSYKVEIRDSIFRDTIHPYTGGGGYLLGCQQGSSEFLLENNVFLFGDKAMVMRSCGAGSVVGYNYVDDSYIGNDLGWAESGMNAAHMAGSHAVLFEGNYSHNFDQDNTWGSSVRHVVLRNHISGSRLSFPETSFARAVGGAYGSYWQAIIGNVLGLSTYAADKWIFEDPADGTYGSSSSVWGLPNGYDGTIYRIGIFAGGGFQSRRPDVKVRSTFVREGNFDFLTDTQKWDRSGSFTIPNSLYLAGKPPFFGGGDTWPWVDPTGATKLYTLPAQTRANALIAAATAPSAPVINQARIVSSNSVEVSFYPPTSNGGRVITGYTVTSSPGGYTASVSVPAAKPTPITITVVPNVSYTFTVTATNVIGVSSASAASNAVTPIDNLPPPSSNITLVQSAYGAVGGSAAATASATLTNPVTAGNLFVVFTKTSGSTTTPTITDTLGNTYDNHQVISAANYPRMALFSAVNVSTGSNTVQCSFSPASVWEFCFVAEFAPGAGAIWPATVAGRHSLSGTTTGGGVTDLVSTAITSNDLGLLVMAASQSAQNITYTAGTDFTLIVGDIAVGASEVPGGVEYDVRDTQPASYVAHMTSSNGTPNYRLMWGYFKTTPGGDSVPTAPLNVTAAAGNAQATVTFAAPASNGGQPITLYTATSSPGSFTGTATTVTPITVSGLSNGTAYTFTVTATNAVGTGPASEPSNSVTPAATVPGAPTIGTATPGNGQATVAFTPPSNNGGATITGYTATSNPGGQTGTGASSPITVTGLSNGNAYTFTVTATNSVGTGPPSAASNSVIPVAPATVPGAPVIGTATAGNAQATVTFSPPGSNGGSAITGYTATSFPGNISNTGSGSPIVVSGLTNGTPYSFTVTATNAIGTSNPSASSNQVTPATVPSAPTIGTATAGGTTAAVAFTPGSDGGSPILYYTATSSPGSLTGQGAGSPVSVGGLSFGTAYSFTVTATNALGTSAASAASNNVTLTASGILRTLSADLFHLASGPCMIRSGAGAPDSTLGSVCDEYLRTDSPYTIYRKTDTSTWAAISTGSGGATPYGQGNLIVANSTTSLGQVPSVAVGSVLRSNGANVLPSWTDSPQLTAIGGTSNLTLSPAGDVIMGAAGNDLLPSVGYTKNIGALTNKFLTLHAAELWVETLVAQNTIATIGGRVLVGPTTTLTADLASNALFITVKHNQAAAGDILYLEANGSVEFLRVTSAPTGSGPYTYAVVRNLDGSGANAWTAGDAVFNTGAAGDGFIDLYSISAVNGPAVFGPTIAGRVRLSATYSDMEPRWAIGNLNGVFGYGQNIYGAAFGDGKATPTGPWLKLDANTVAEGGGGIRAGHGSTTYFSIDPTGQAYFAGNITVGTGGRNMLSNSEFIRGRGTGDRNGHYWGGKATDANPGGTVTCAAPCSNNANPDGTSGFDNTTGLGVTIGVHYDDNWVPTHGGALYWTPSAVPAAGTFTRVWGPQVPVQHGRPYEFSFYGAVHRGGNLTSRVLWFNAAGTYIGESDGSPGAVCTAATTGGRNLANYGRCWGLFTAPTSTSESGQAHYAIPVFMQLYDVVVGEAPYSFVTRAYFGEAQAGQTTPSPWGPAGNTLITGDMLSTDLVLTNTLRSSGATTLTQGTGFWLDATGTPTFRVGEPVAAGNDYVYWNGTSLDLQSATLKIDSTGIKLTPGGTTTWVNGNAYRFEVGSTDNLGLYAYRDGSAQSAIVQSRSSLTAFAQLIASNLTTSSAVVTATNSGTVSLSTTVSGSAYAGDIVLGGIPQFLGSTSGTAGALIGYITVKVGSTTRLIPYYAVP